ncbi:nucleotide sugar dehydrogenase [Streptomyces sp. NPDC048720]|uniref:nucleotide sugar dehydrogenase n=1 Tax=Streptomyces sp. NPDC048720 TaxID=3365588 RepID=UPI00371952B2
MTSDIAVTRPRPTRVGVIGLGYTGLPLALGLANAGHLVTGYDIDETKLDALRGGHSYLADVRDEDLAVTHGSLVVTSDSAALSQVESVIVCVPTPTTEDGAPDLRAFHSVFEVLAARIGPGALVVVQSTVPPGTTARAAALLGERLGLTPGEDFYVANAPERINPANAEGWNLANTPKLVGGINEASALLAQRLLASVCKVVVPVRSLEVAEAAKVFENTFRLVNITLTYELEALCNSIGISVHDVIDAAATKPYGFLAHRPGPGIGGECIPVDPHFLRSVAVEFGVATPLVDEACRRANQRPLHVVDRLAELLSDADKDVSTARVLVVGVAYKPGVSDTRNSPSVEVISALQRRGAKVSYVDPSVAELVVDGERVERVAWDRSSVVEHDCVVLMTPDRQIVERPLWYAAPLVLDTWNLAAPGDGIHHL